MLFVISSVQVRPEKNLLVQANGMKVVYVEDAWQTLSSTDKVCAELEIVQNRHWPMTAETLTAGTGAAVWALPSCWVCIYLPPIIWQNCLARPVQLPPTQLTMTATSQPRFRKWWLGLWEFWQVGELSRNSMHRGNSSLFALQESEYEWWDDRYMDNPKKAGASQGTAQIMLWRVMRLVLLPVIGFAFIVRIIASCNVFGVFFPKPFSKYMSFSSVNIQLMKSILKR